MGTKIFKMSEFSRTTQNLLYNEFLSIHDCIRVPKELLKKNVHPYYCCASYGPNHPYYQEDCNDVRVGGSLERQVCAEARHEGAGN